MSRKNDFDIFLGNEPLIQKLLTVHLNQGSLGLFLGAGASMGIGLPNWQTLVERCAEKLSLPINYDTPSKPTQQELDMLMEDVKSKSSTKFHYVKLIQEQLYEGVHLNFKTANKDLLIALSSLIIGSIRGSIDTIVTLNFDSIFEWYLTINGLKLLVTSEEGQIRSVSDVEIIHLHGFLPHSKMKQYTPSNDIVFTWNELKERLMTHDIWKERLYDFFRSKVFLSVGVNPVTLLDYLKTYLLHINKQNELLNIRKRLPPYGVAIFPPEDDSSPTLIKKRASDNQQLLDIGIIPYEMPIEKIPEAIFNIAQNAAGFPVDSIM